MKTYKGGSRRKTQAEVMGLLAEIYGDEYDFSASVYLGSKKDMQFVCTTHGVVSKKAELLLGNRSRGCPECGKEKASKNKRIGTEGLLRRFRAQHGDRYEYPAMTATGQYDRIVVVCKIHGPFSQRAVDHMHGTGCPPCGRLRLAASRQLTKQHFIERARRTHGDRYAYDKAVCDGGVHGDVIITCREHGDFLQAPSNHYQGKGCSACSYKNPKAEDQICDFLDTLGVAYRRSNRTLIRPYELDIYIPEYKLAIEHNGLYWHSDAVKDNARQYHIMKRDMCSAKGVRLLQIFEDEWLFRREAVELIIKGATKANDRTFARNTECFIEPAKAFFDRYHHAGAAAASKTFVLKERGEVVMAMSLRKWSSNRVDFFNGEWELCRVTSSKTVVGGLSKLLKAAQADTHISRIVSFVDRRYFDGHSLEKIGFTFDHLTDPTGWYVKAMDRKHPRNFTRAKAFKQFGSGYATADAAVRANGYSRLFDCGHARFMLECK